MIIVSQDRKRITENLEICIYEGDNKKIIIENDYMFLGEYETEERAKEVLEELIHWYSTTDLADGINYAAEKVIAYHIKRNQSAYYMPEK